MRRRAVGLGPLAENIEQIRADARSYGECATGDLASRKAAAEINVGLLPHVKMRAKADSLPHVNVRAC
jgi:hypothetical protein